MQGRYSVVPPEYCPLSLSLLNACWVLRWQKDSKNVDKLSTDFLFFFRNCDIM